MRKNMICLLTTLVLILAFSGISYADGPVKKLGRGLANIVTSPLEIPKDIQDAAGEKGVTAGLSWGLIKGVVDLGIRAVVGAYEVVTFPVPLPAEYKPILTDPEFFGEKEFRWFNGDPLR